MMSALARARRADAEARDAIARLLDVHLSCVPPIRTISARLLTRSPTRSGGNTAARLAGDRSLPSYALTSRIQRRGGASMLELRDEIVLTRLAFCFRDRRATWPLVAEILEITHLALLRRIVRRRRHMAPGRWRLSVTVIAQLGALDTFLRIHTPRWRDAAQASRSRITAA